MDTPLRQRSFSTAELADIFGITRQAVLKRAVKWESEKRMGRGGGKVWKFASMSEAEQYRISTYVLNDPQKRFIPDPLALAAQEVMLKDAWERYEKKSAKVKERAMYRYKLLFEAWELHCEGSTMKAAFELVAAKYDERVANLRRWYYGTRYKPGVRGLDPKDWLPVLADDYKGRTACAACSEEAWKWLVADFFRREEPPFTISYERLARLAAEKSWEIPCERTLRRRMKREYTQAEITYARKGTLAYAFPREERRRDSFRAGEAVSGDGLKFDSFYVIFPDGEVVSTTTGWFWEDVYSGKILAYEVDKTENTDMFRKATYKLTGVCLPRYAWLDNTRVAANKSMTGQADNRHRFTNQETDPVGILKLAGMIPQFTNPDQEMSNPGAKPIERAFGIGGIHERLRTWPSLAGRGHSLNTAIHLEEFLECLELVVREYNAKTGRRGGICNGRSFDEVFNTDFSEAAARKASPEIRRLLLHDQEVCKVSREATVRIKAGRGDDSHRYYAEMLAQFVGEHVAVMFNPEDLTAPVRIYSLAGKYLCEARWIPAVGFKDKAAGRELSRERKRHNKLIKKTVASAKRISDIERQQLNVTVPYNEISQPAHSTTVLAPFEVQKKLDGVADTEKQIALQERLRRNMGGEPVRDVA